MSVVLLGGLAQAALAQLLDVLVHVLVGQHAVLKEVLADVP